MPQEGMDALLQKATGYFYWALVNECDISYHNREAINVTVGRHLW